MCALCHNAPINCAASNGFCVAGCINLKQHLTDTTIGKRKYPTNCYEAAWRSGIDTFLLQVKSLIYRKTSYCFVVWLHITNSYQDLDFNRLKKHLILVFWLIQTKIIILASYLLFYTRTKFIFYMVWQETCNFKHTYSV